MITWSALRKGARVALLGAGLTLGSLAAAQAGPAADGAPPDVPRDYLAPARRLEGDVLRFCLYPSGMTGELDRAVARAIADALLLEARVYEVTTRINVPGFDAIPISEEELYVYLHNECDAFLGFTLGPDVYDPWITVSRPYVTTRFVAVTFDEDLRRLGDLPPRSVVGTVMVSEGDVALGSYLRSLPEDRQWRRFPYPEVLVLTERLADGTVAAAVAWEPALRYAEERLGLAPREVSSDPVSLPTRDVGMVLRADQLYVRDAIDTAIAALAQDGTLERIYQQVGFPGVTHR